MKIRDAVSLLVPLLLFATSLHSFPFMPFKNRLVVTFRPRYIFRFNKNSTASSNNFDLLKTLLSSETYSALGNVRSIIQKLESENVTGVENVFHRYSSWDIYQSVLSLSYLQKQRQQQRQEVSEPFGRRANFALKFASWLHFTHSSLKMRTISHDFARRSSNTHPNKSRSPPNSFPLLQSIRSTHRRFMAGP